MPTKHVVREGESLIPIARRYGFRNVRTIFDAPENEALKALRRTVNALRTGDVLMIPDKMEGDVAVPAGDRYTFHAGQSRGVWNLRWWPDEGYCGDPTFLTGNTDLRRSKVELQPSDEGNHSPLHALELAIEDGSLMALEWSIHDVWLVPPGPDSLDARATWPSYAGDEFLDGQARVRGCAFSNEVFIERLPSYLGEVHAPERAQRRLGSGTEARARRARARPGDRTEVEVELRFPDAGVYAWPPSGTGRSRSRQKARPREATHGSASSRR